MIPLRLEEDEEASKRFNTNKRLINSHLSREDVELVSKGLNEHGKLTKEQA